MPDTHALLAPSAADRWLHCTPSARLEAELPESISEYAEEGRLAHSVCELIARKKFTIMKSSAFNAALKELKADPRWDDEMLATANTYVEHLTELAMKRSYAPYVALEVRVDISEYVPEAHGTCDCVMISGEELIITDYKHGKGVPVSAEENPQMMLYALGALTLYRPVYGNTIKRVTCYIDQPRRDSYEGYGLTVSELLAWGENTVAPKAALAHTGMGEYIPGDWCRFCRARAICRARAGAHTALEDFVDKADPKNLPPLLTNTEVSDLLIRGKALAEWYEALKEYALTACLRGETIPGWKTVEGRSARVWANQDKALEVIMAAGFDRALVYDSVPKSLAQLEKLVGAARFNELVADLVVKPPGKPALVQESDKRTAYSSAATDFEVVSA